MRIPESESSLEPEPDFVDSSALYALLDWDDQNRVEASKI